MRDLHDFGRLKYLSFGCQLFIKNAEGVSMLAFETLQKSHTFVHNIFGEAGLACRIKEAIQNWFMFKSHVPKISELCNTGPHLEQHFIPID